MSLGLKIITLTNNSSLLTIYLHMNDTITPTVDPSYRQVNNVERNLAEAGSVDWLGVAVVTVVKVVNVESATWNTDTFSYLVVLLQPATLLSPTSSNIINLPL